MATAEVSKRIRPRPAALVAAALLAASAAADPRLYAVDRTASTAEFRLRYLGLVPASGTFAVVTGTVLFDPARWDGLAVNVRIPLTGLAARPEFWRNQLLSARFFDAARYPTMEFNADHARRLGGERGEAFGQLTLHGQTHPLVLAARVVRRDTVLEIDATTVLRRSAFGLTGMAGASDAVTVVLHLRAAAIPSPAQ